MPYLHTIEQVNECPIARAAELVGDLWVLLIVRDLMGGPKRFKNLQESLGSISPKTLSQRLKMLEETGLINREAFAEIPPRVEYSLTEKGLALSDVIEAIRNFGGDPFACSRASGIGDVLGAFQVRNTAD